MNKHQLIKSCNAFIGQDARFKRIDTAASFVKIRNKEYSEIRQDGTWEGYPARLVTLPDKDACFLRPEEDYMGYLKNHLIDFPNAVHVPSLLHEQKIDDMHYYVIERPEGRPIIDTDVLTQPLISTNGEVTINDQLKEFARVYRDTASAIRNACFDGAIAPGFYDCGISSAGYIRDRFLEMKLHFECHPVRHMPRLVSDKQLVQLLGLLFLDTDWDKVPMTLSFVAFRNDDIVKTKEGRYYIINGCLDLKPEHFGVATFFQEIFLHGYDKSVEQLNGEAEVVIGAFIKALGGLDNSSLEALHLNLIERLYHAMEVTLRYQLDPYEHLPVEAAQEMRKTLHQVFTELIDFLEA